MRRYHCVGRLIVDSWAIRWQLASFLSNSLTIYPKHSLIANAGFDGTGTHGGVTGLLARSGVQGTFLPKIFPKETKLSDSWGEVCCALKNRISILEKIKSWLNAI